MKHLLIKRGTALLLFVCLLLALAPAVMADDSAEAFDEPTIQFITEPKYAVTFNRFAGRYCAFIDSGSNSAGICDCFGTVTMYGKNDALEPFENGMAMEMGKNDEGYNGWAVLSPTGERLTPYTSGGEMACPVDRYTGRVYNWLNAEFRADGIRMDFNGNDPFGGRYDSVSSIIWNGQFAYSKDGKWGIDTVDGSHILPCEYEHLELCGVDRCVFSENGKYGILDLSGKVLLAASYDMLWLDETGTGFYAVKDGKHGIVTSDLRQTVPCDYDAAGCFSENVSYGMEFDSDRLVIYDAEGNIKTDVTGAYNCYNSNHRMFMYYIENGDGTGTFTVLNAAGETVIDGKRAKTGAVSEDLILLENNGNTDVYDKSGTLLGTVENALPVNFQDTIPMVVRDGMYAIIGADGKLSTDFVYNMKGYAEKDNIVCMRRGERWYFVSRSGKEYPEGGFDREVLFSSDSDYAGYMVNGYSGILRYVGTDDSQFADVADDAWYRTAADYCAEKGLMAGTAPGRFSPNVTTTRSMLVTILYSLSGAEAQERANPFTDVPNGQWYTPAVLWAAENGIVSGYGNGKFGSNDPVTREQIAAILYSYAKKYGMDVTAQAELDSFPDAVKVSGWAADAVRWAVANGLISGSVIGGQTLLDPQGKATRAMTACILMRFTQPTD